MLRTPETEPETADVKKNLTVKEAAARLAISVQCVYQLCSRKKLAHLRLGVGRGVLRIPESALDEFVARSIVQPDGTTAPEPTPVKLKHLKF